MAQATSVFGRPLSGISSGERARFEAGKESFEEVEAVADGIGPVFNDVSCVACHDGQATGGGSAILSVRIGTTTNGRFDPLINRGGPVLQKKGIGPVGDVNFVGEVVPPEATLVANRRATQVFGLGLVDATPDFQFELLSFLQHVVTPNQAGRPNRVIDQRTGEFRVGRFGWKAQLSTLFDFSGDAYKEEMGITVAGHSDPDNPGTIRPFFADGDGRLLSKENPPQGDESLLLANPVEDPNEPDDEDLVLFTDFMTFLAPPPRGNQNVATLRGSVLFEQIGCAVCHKPTLITGFNWSPTLSFRVYHPYSDFLLHDMGSLGDGIEQGTARGSEMRTAPLWGLRVQPSFLHDGRATTIEDAIREHRGQGQKANDNFDRLSTRDRAALLEFLRSL
jgi:CxxC motif-containing protein (DUF1111 family)